jgi:hypothetical protein
MQMAVFRGASWTVAQGTSPTRAHGVLYADQFPGADIGEQINNAYASCPSSGCVVDVAPGSYSFSTPIIANTNNKALVINCGYGSNSFGPTVLNYTKSMGTAVTLATGLGSSLKGCTLLGMSNASSAVGISVSNTSGALQTPGVFENNSVSLFGTCLLFGNYAYLNSFRENAFFNCSTVLSYPSSVTGSGEDLVFYGGLFQGIIGSYSATCVNIASDAETISFFGVSFDSCGITLNGTGINFTMAGGNLENKGSMTGLDFFTIGSLCIQCSALLDGINLSEDSAGSRSHIITNGAIGGHLTINRGKYFLGSMTPIAELVNGAAGSFTTAMNPFFNVQPTVIVGGGGAATTISSGVTTSSTYFVLNGTSWTAGGGPPGGNCIGSSGIYTNSSPADLSHVLYVCAGNTWQNLNAP